MLIIPEWSHLSLPVLTVAGSARVVYIVAGEIAGWWTPLNRHLRLSGLKFVWSPVSV